MENIPTNHCLKEKETQNKKEQSRPEAMEEASVMMVGMNTERILQGLAALETQKREKKRILRQVSDYSMPNVSDKVERIILSYTDYILSNHLERIRDVPTDKNKMKHHTPSRTAKILFCIFAL